MGDLFDGIRATTPAKYTEKMVGAVASILDVSIDELVSQAMLEPVGDTEMFVSFTVQEGLVQLFVRWQGTENAGFAQILYVGNGKCVASPYTYVRVESASELWKLVMANRSS